MPSPSAERRDRERLEVRKKMIDAAREILVSEGPDAVSMRRIADKIQYSPTALYVHFADKTALMAELCSNDFRLLAHAFVDAAAVKDPIERMRAAGRAYLKFAHDNPHHYRVMFMTPMADAERREIESLSSVHRGKPDEDAYAFLRMLVAQAFESGRVKPEHKDQDLVAQVMWSAIHGVAAINIAKGNSGWMEWRPIEAIAEQTMDALMVWLTGEPAKPSKKKKRSAR